MIDWRKLIADLRAHGVSTDEIALAVVQAGGQATGQAIRRLSCGETKEPKFTTGATIIALHREKCSSSC